MSMIGSSHLNQIINERGILRPSEILNHLNTGITEALKQTDKEVNDGMDIALCSLDLQNLRLEYAGANRPLWLFRNSEWIEIKPDKLPISGFRVNREAVFTNHEIELRQGDTIYLFTDGFADQFGGPDGKRFSPNVSAKSCCRCKPFRCRIKKRNWNHFLMNGRKTRNRWMMFW